MKHMRFIVFFALLSLAGAFAYAGSSQGNEDLLSQIQYDEATLAGEIATEEPYPLDAVTQVIENLFGENIRVAEDKKWEDDRRVSFFTSQGKLAYDKLSGAFKYWKKDAISRWIDQCNVTEGHQQIAESVLEDLHAALPDFPSTWMFIKRHEYIADSGTAEGPNYDDTTVLYEYRFTRLIDGVTPSVGPGSETRVYLSPCGELKALKMNWRRATQARAEKLPLRSKGEVAEWMQQYRYQFHEQYNGFVTDEKVRCGYYEPEDEESASVLHPVCMYSAIHTLEPFSGSATTSPITLVIPLTFIEGEEP